MRQSKTTKWSKIPTLAEIDAFDGLHCSTSYREAAKSHWRCPCCDRSPAELIRWSEIRGQFYRKLNGDKFGMGWTVSLTRHHCHSTNGHDTSRVGRFKEALICGDCNTADAMAKRKLGLPKDFSFSPEELAQFVRCVPHSGQKDIDYERAHRLFQQAVGSEADATTPEARDGKRSLTRVVQLELFPLAEPPAAPKRPRSLGESRTWPDYARCLHGAPVMSSGNSPDVSRADYTFCLIAVDWGFGREATAAKLMQESAKAKARGEHYAARTVERAAAAVARRRLKRVNYQEPTPR